MTEGQPDQVPAVQAVDGQQSEDSHVETEEHDAENSEVRLKHSRTIPPDAILADRKRPSRGAVLAAVLLLAGYACLGALPAWRAEPLAFVSLDLMLFAMYAAGLALWLNRRGRAWGRLFLISGVVFRLVVLLLHPPDLSLDVARYAWDGHLTTSGVNPFAFAPSAPELIPLRTSFFGDITYKVIPTIYPPVAQVLFALAALLATGTFPLRVLLTLSDMGILLVIARLLRDANLPEGRLLIYAWCPLPVIEVCSSGHVEPLGSLCLLLAAAALGGRRRGLAGLAWAGSVLTKIGPLLLAPILVRRLRWRGMLAAVVAGVLLYLPFAWTGPRLGTALLVYGRHWRYNDFFFAFLVRAVETSGAAALTARCAGLVQHLVSPAAGRMLAAMASPGGTARLVAAALLTAWTVRIARSPIRRHGPAVDFLLDAGRIMVVALLMAPTLHPWYLLWLLPLLSFAPSPAWILLCGTVVLSYLDLDQLTRRPGGLSLAVWMEYLPVVIMALALSAAGGRGKRRPALIPHPPRDKTAAGLSGPGRFS
ncbi:MAG: glycosyltransferase 87 family protein [Acidobacteriota bacterium]